MYWDHLLLKYNIQNCYWVNSIEGTLCYLCTENVPISLGYTLLYHFNSYKISVEFVLCSKESDLKKAQNLFLWLKHTRLK